MVSFSFVFIALLVLVYWYTSFRDPVLFSDQRVGCLEELQQHDVHAGPLRQAGRKRPAGHCPGHVPRVCGPSRGVCSGGIVDDIGIDKEGRPFLEAIFSALAGYSIWEVG